jgi:hypothetical protein
MSDTPPKPLKRGVYRSPFLSRTGHRKLVAVNSKGWRVAHALVFRRDSEADVAEMLARQLDRQDSALA